MKNVLTVIINPAASPATTGILPPKHVLRNVQVLINILAPAPAIPAAAVRLATDYIVNVTVLTDIFGAESRAIKKTPV